MARRNGKTFVVSGVAAAILLKMTNRKCEGVSLAIFSTGERMAKTLMTVVVEMVELAFNKGSHVNRQEYTQVMKNKECLLFEGPDGSKRLLGCFPGSVRVKKIFLFYLYFKTHVWVIITHCIKNVLLLLLLFHWSKNPSISLFCDSNASVFSTTFFFLN